MVYVSCWYNTSKRTISHWSQQNKLLLERFQGKPFVKMQIAGISPKSAPLIYTPGEDKGLKPSKSPDASALIRSTGCFMALRDYIQRQNCTVTGCFYGVKRLKGRTVQLLYKCNLALTICTDCSDTDGYSPNYTSLLKCFFCMCPLSPLRVGRGGCDGSEMQLVVIL